MGLFKSLAVSKPNPNLLIVVKSMNKVYLTVKLIIYIIALIVLCYVLFLLNPNSYNQLLNPKIPLWMFLSLILIPFALIYQIIISIKYLTTKIIFKFDAITGFITKNGKCIAMFNEVKKVCVRSCDYLWLKSLNSNALFLILDNNRRILIADPTDFSVLDEGEGVSNQNDFDELYSCGHDIATLLNVEIVTEDR